MASDPVHEQLALNRDCEQCCGRGYFDAVRCGTCKGTGSRGPGWYFWDETWSDRHGPYETESIAREKLKQYVEEVL